MRRSRTTGLWLLLVLGLPSIASTECKFSSSPQPQKLTETSWLYTWQEEFSTTLLEYELPTAEIFRTYRKLISKRINTDQVELLKRQRDKFIHAFGAEAALPYNQILEERIGKVLPIRCLDALLLQQHLMLQSELLKPTEFTALVLRKGTEIRLYQLIGQHVSPPGIENVAPLLDADLKSGWSLTTHLHNHPFFLENLPKADVAGTIIPSGTVGGGGDLREYEKLKKAYGLSEAWITNGFHTIVLTAREFDRFE